MFVEVNKKEDDTTFCILHQISLKFVSDGLIENEMKEYEWYLKPQNIFFDESNQGE